jgi:hypothetical protein
MFKQTALISWADGGGEDARAQLLARVSLGTGARLSRFGAALAASHKGGDLVWHLHYDDQAAWAASGAQATLDALEADPLVVSVDAVGYAIARFAVPEPGLTNGAYRTLFLKVDEGTPPEIVSQFAEDVAGMQSYIPEIVNWALNPTHMTRGAVAWTHIWEQEFADVSGLTGPYMTSAYHWGWVDRWFDPEMPCRIVDDGTLRHSASVLTASVMADY